MPKKDLREKMDLFQIYFIRHAESISNQEKIYQGWADVSLSETGKKQALALRNYLLKHNINFKQVYSSPMKRAMETAQILHPCSESKIIIQEEGFKAINVGKWQGEPISTIKEKYKEKYDNWIQHPDTFRFPEGESPKDVLNRARDRLLTQILDLDWEENIKIAIVTHMIVIKVLLVWLLEKDLSQLWDLDHQVPNTGIIVFEGKRIQQQGKRTFGFKRIPLDDPTPHLE